MKGMKRYANEKESNFPLSYTNNCRTVSVIIKQTLRTQVIQ